jgi:hypothetical protein
MVKAKDLLAWYAGQVGVREVGRNGGKMVNWYQSSTGAYNAAWCVSFIQKGLQMFGVGPIFDRTAGVFYFVMKARKAGLVRSKPLRGYAIAFMNGQGHIGVIETVHHSGELTTLEGNHNNMVARVRRPARGNYVFVKLPGVDYNTFIEPPPKPKPRWVPRFQIVSGEGSKAKVIVGWDKWKVVNARIPRLVAAGRAFQIRRKLVKA